MWIVKLALRNPYTVGVIAAFIFLMGGLSIFSMKTDVLPIIDIPAVNIVYQYNGLSAEEMENRVIFIAERSFTTSVNGITKMVSKSLPGVGLIQVYFEQDTDIGAAIAQISASASSSLAIMPRGIQPPVIVQFNASNIPVAQLTITGDGIPEEKLFDYAQNFVRLKLYTIPGLSTPAPYGGRARQVAIDVQQELMAAKGISAQDVVAALSAANIVIPAGSARLGDIEYNVIMNSSPEKIEEFATIPIKTIGQQTITIGQVANVYDGFQDPNTMVKINGTKATFLNIIKKASASTLDVLSDLKEAIPAIQATAPKGMKVQIDFDQSKFVKAAVSSVLSEALLAATLVSLMILFFLGSWRSVFIVCTSIPLAIFSSIIFLYLTGQTLNIMTLGGLSLAIGMLVDDATVEVENIHRNIKTNDNLVLAILHGAKQVALPAIMATLSICIVFAPIVLLTGPALYLFSPMALAVVFAMLASYVLSRTLVPVLARMLLGKEHAEEQGEGEEKKKGRFAARVEKFNAWRDRKFDQIRDRYESILSVLIHQKVAFLGSFVVIVLVSCLLPVFVVGQDFFPRTDSGMLKMIFRARTGTRLEETEKIIDRVERSVRQVIPAEELQTFNALIGIPFPYSLAYVPTDLIGSMDAEIQIAFNDGHQPTEMYAAKIREKIAREFPGSVLYFQPAGIVEQVLNFGLSSTIDVQVQARQFDEAYKIAQKLLPTVKRIPGLVDTHIQQVIDFPTLYLAVDREKASRMGLSQSDIASSLLISLSSSFLYAPSFYLNPENNVQYNVLTKVPYLKFEKTEDLLKLPVTSVAGGMKEPASPSADQYASTDPSGTLSATTQSVAATGPVNVLGNLANVTTGVTASRIDHNNVQRVADITAGLEGRDLGAVSREINAAIKDLGELPPGVTVSLLGQAETMNTAFSRLALGLVIAVILVYLLMVVLFQSWLDPFIILLTLPSALVGILWMLSLTGTTINVMSLMGSIMAIGIAVANSILVVSFANDLRVEKGIDALTAAIEAGRTRLRPVIMTALAMILGMLPMAFGHGAAAQNAPLARAVIGGLLIATLSTLFMVPIFYSMLRKSTPVKAKLQQDMKKFEKQFDKEQAELEAQPAHS